MNKPFYFTLLFLISASLLFAHSGTVRQARYAVTAPVIDGDGNDEVWSQITEWYDYRQIWLDNENEGLDDNDFSWRYKLAWDENHFYVLAEITDDVVSDIYTDPTESYWEDDCFEVFFDEDNSGGNHQETFNAFAYHVSIFYDVVDYNGTGPGLFNDHVDVEMKTINGKHYWEAAFKVYDDTYVYNGQNTPVTLTAGKVMGWAMAYCDNDGGTQRDQFYGSELIEGENKNIAWQTADVFGDVELLDPTSASYSHALVDDGLDNPTAMVIADNGDIYITEQSGTLKVVSNGQLQQANLVDLNVNLDGVGGYTERGLLGVTLDPEFSTNNYVYLFYTSSTPTIHNRVSRFQLDGTTDVSNTEQMIVELDDLTSAINHNGGALHFLPDGTLLIGTGENATPSFAQDLSNSHGKLLRINKDGSIPADNPFVGQSNVDQRIWSYGLRNPFTFDVSSAGQVLLNDVGQVSWEEINDATQAGLNFGWPTEEGNGSNPSFQEPLYHYQNVQITEADDAFTDSTGCAITGGVFFDPVSTNYPLKYAGKYFFMDYCGDWINVIDPLSGGSRETFASDMSGSPIAIDVHPDGNLYYLTRDNGAVYKIVYSGSALPEIVNLSSSVAVPETQPIELIVEVSGQNPFSYQWKKDGVAIQGQTNDTLYIASSSMNDAGNYVVEVTNQWGSVTSSEIVVTITEANSKPVITLSHDQSDEYYEAGQNFTFSGSATDAEDGVISSSMMTWTVDLYHGNHVHDGVPFGGVNTLSFTIPVAGGHTETNVWYRITLEVEDAGGLKASSYIDIFPTIIELTVETEPAGLEVLVDGNPFITPYSFQSVKGVRRELDVAEKGQTVAGTLYGYDFWGHTDDQMNFIEPTAATTYVVNFKELPIESEELSVIEDAYVQYTEWRPVDATTAFGDTDPENLVVKNYELDPDRQTYLKFNFSQIVGIKEDFIGATLNLRGYMMDEDGAASITVEAYEGTSSNWSEGSITWDNQPGRENVLYDAVNVSSFEVADYQLDVTNLVNKAFLQGADEITIALVSSSDHKNRVFFNSKESNGLSPYLTLEYQTVTAVEEKVTDVEIYPNPTVNTMIIENASTDRWELFDISGNKIHEGVGSEVNVADLPSGSYFIKVGDNNFRFLKL